MTVEIGQLRDYLKKYDFRSLFMDGLGWDHFPSDPIVFEDGENRYTLNPIAEKSGFAVYVCQPGEDGDVPPHNLQRRIEITVAREAYEHLIIFVDAEQSLQIWQWVKREPGVASKTNRWEIRAGQSGDSLLQRIQGFAFDFSDQAKGIGITDVVERVKKALDVDKITRRFYEHFKKELFAFESFIQGIKDADDRAWYASLTLNRMMFVYFVQKRRFLDGDPDYLRNRLLMVRDRFGSSDSGRFYHEFLLKLFYEGLGKPETERSVEAIELLGKVPYFNGGLFDVHNLERFNTYIDIPDEAFTRIFEFFDEYRWHLDERPHHADNEINPDVLGYIFEKYVNQKQMGAYYTQEDITSYISRSTIIPFLFDAAERHCPVAFHKDGAVWEMLRENPDRYIFPDVGHGVTWDARDIGNHRPLDRPLELPHDVAKGLGDIAQRGIWKNTAREEFALPSETWREVVARRQRHEMVRQKMLTGAPTTINDLIGLNVDIDQFAKDAILQSEGPELLGAFWRGLCDLSVLDPACGSGAFLFAALNILEPLYSACLESMRGFLDDLERTKRRIRPDACKEFRDILSQVARHPNERHFIFKTIMLNNLYGVDIMEEAVEICKLRLYLKLVSQIESYHEIEPLPDIDFNIRVGNTLVGFTSLDAVREAITLTSDGQHRALFAEDLEILSRIENEAEITSAAFDWFRWQQTLMSEESVFESKVDLRNKLETLTGELDQRLASFSNVDKNDTNGYELWLTTHKPFHWFVEFFGIMNNGGFDVVIGNPPYVSKNKIDYTVPIDSTGIFPDIFANMVNRSMALTARGGRCGMIVPLSVTFSRDYIRLRESLIEWGTCWFSSYDNIPAALFNGVSQRCTIWIGHNRGQLTFVAPMLRWRAANRPYLIHNVAYVPAMRNSLGRLGLPKLGDDVHGRVLARILAPNSSQQRSMLRGRSSKNIRVGFSQSARNFVSVFRADPPCLDGQTLNEVPPSKIGTVLCSTEEAAMASLAALSGETFFWYWLVRGDGFDVTSWLINDYLTILDHIPQTHFECLAELGSILDEERNKWLVFKKNAGKYVGNFNYRGARQITRRSDLLLLDVLTENRHQAVSILEYVQRVLAINANAGEKGIPSEVKNKYPFSGSHSRLDETFTSRVDSFLIEKLGFDGEELEFLIYDDVGYDIYLDE